MKVVIATDGTPTSIHALTEAIRILPLRESEVYLVSVLDPELRIGANEHAHEEVAQGVAILEASGVKAVPVERRGPFAEEIVAEATAVGADVIVVGSAGRGGLAQFFLGSVSSEVIHAWKGAVLVVRHP